MASTSNFFSDMILIYFIFRCYLLDELVGPLRNHLAPKLSDALFTGILGGASKRLEAAIRRVSSVFDLTHLHHFF